MVQILRFLSDDDGATALEYGLLAALIAASIVGAVTNFGQVMIDAFDFISSAMQAAIGSST